MNQIFKQVYMELEKEKLVEKLEEYMNIELKDRCFANECCASLTIYNINKLFEKLESGEKLYEQDIRDAESSWNYIVENLYEMKTRNIKN